MLFVQESQAVLTRGGNLPSGSSGISFTPIASRMRAPLPWCYEGRNSEAR